MFDVFVIVIVVSSILWKLMQYVQTFLSVNTGSLTIVDISPLQVIFVNTKNEVKHVVVRAPHHHDNIDQIVYQMMHCQFGIPVKKSDNTPPLVANVLNPGIRFQCFYDPIRRVSPMHQGVVIPLAVWEITNKTPYPSSLNSVQTREISNLINTINMFRLTRHTITRIEFYKNRQLEEIFRQTKTTLERHGRSSHSVMLFHGTPAENVKSYVILKNNLM